MATQGDRGISWTDATWNPIRGCTEVSPGCANCYAKGVAARFSGPGMPYEGLARFEERPAPGGGTRKLALWSNVVRDVPEHFSDPLRWQRPRRIFVNSMSDLFHDAIPVDVIATIFAVMGLAQQHTFQVLTKRPIRMHRLLGDPAFEHEVAQAARRMFGQLKPPRRAAFEWGWPLPNVQLGVTAEDQQRAEERMDLLGDTPAWRRFVSVEPQLEAVTLRKWLRRRFETSTFGPMPFFHWVIVGAESGPGARPWNEDWARILRDECAASGAAFFYDQRLGADGKKVHTPELDGRRWVDFPSQVGPWATL